MIGAVVEDAVPYIVGIPMGPVTVLFGSLVVTTTECPNTVMLTISKNTFHVDEGVA